MKKFFNKIFLLITIFTTVLLCFCGCKFGKGNETEHVHQWSEWEFYKDYTCAYDAEEARTCSDCGEVETSDHHVSSEIMGDSATVAEYFTSKYCSYSWRKE